MESRSNNIPEMAKMLEREKKKEKQEVGMRKTYNKRVWAAGLAFILLGLVLFTLFVVLNGIFLLFGGFGFLAFGVMYLLHHLDDDSYLVYLGKEYDRERSRPPKGTRQQERAKKKAEAESLERIIMEERRSKGYE